nr:unnamed protein product [Callosobruchus analis]
MEGKEALASKQASMEGKEALASKGLAAILQKGLTVQEAIDITFGEIDNSNECVETIYIALPDPAALTDEDSGDEDEGGDFDNLSKRHLLADAEIRVVGVLTVEDEPVVHSESNEVVFHQRKIRLLHISHTRRFLNPVNGKASLAA